MTIIARSQYDVRPEVASDLSFVGAVSLTKQADLKDSDINSIMKRFERTGTLPDMIVRDGRYGDFSNVPDYQTALEIVRLAQDQFDNLDAPIRNRFANDPAKFLEFCSDPKNIDEMEKMGLLNMEKINARKSERAALIEKARVEQEASRLLTEKAREDALVARIKAELAK